MKKYKFVSPCTKTCPFRIGFFNFSPWGLSRDICMYKVMPLNLGKCEKRSNYNSKYMRSENNYRDAGKITDQRWHCRIHILRDFQNGHKYTKNHPRLFFFSNIFIRNKNGQNRPKIGSQPNSF